MRIAEHNSALRQNETLTRTTLVDPLLRGLGWDTTDPGQVFVEYRTESGIVDYALLGGDGKPEVIVEAKKLGSPLRSAVAQAAGYCLSEDLPRFAVTDGRHWELYEMSRPGPLAERRVLFFDLSEPTVDTERLFVMTPRQRQDFRRKQQEEQAPRHKQSAEERRWLSEAEAAKRRHTRKLGRKPQTVNTLPDRYVEFLEKIRRAR